jgi:very-short-patch-repair endonuclease
MTIIFNKKVYTEKRKKLRNNMPIAERILWSRLKAKQLKGYKFRRQYSMGRYIVDFYCPQARLVVELDGESHIGEYMERYDQRRQRYVESLGVICLRFTNWDVYENAEGILEEILSYLS